jgi:hypothetical protein
MAGGWWPGTGRPRGRVALEGAGPDGHVHEISVPAGGLPPHRAPGRIAGSAAGRRTRPGGACCSTARRSRRFRLAVDPRRAARPHHRVVTRLAARLAGLSREAAAYVPALPQRRQERVQDAVLGVTLATVNVFSLLAYRSQLHPLWLALVLVAAQGIPLIWRRHWRPGRSNNPDRR